MIDYKGASPPPAEADGPERAYDSAPQSESVLIQQVRGVYRRRWIAFTTFAAVATVVTVRTYTTVPVYEATSQLLIETDQRKVLTFDDVIQQDRTSYDYAGTQHRLLRSRALARRTLTALNLWNRPPFGGEAATPPAPAWAAQFVSIRNDFGEKLQWVKQALQPDLASVSAVDEGTADSDDRTESAAIDRLLQGLTITPIRNSQLLDVKYRSADPRLAARVANEVVRQYISQAEDIKLEVSQDVSGWLQEQLAEQRQALETSELALQRYREQHDSVTLENSENIVVQKLADLNAAVTRAKMDRIEREAQYNQLLTLQNTGGNLDSFPAILANSYIQELKSDLSAREEERQQLKQRFGEKHPRMVALTAAVESAKAKLDLEVANLVRSVRNEFLAAEAQERSLTDALNTQKSNALAQNRTGIEYGVLQREVATNRELYEGLLQRAKQAGISSELQAAGIRIVDEAEVPRRPILPNHNRDLSVGLLGGLVLAIGFALFLEHLDNRFKTPEEIAMHLGLPCIGLVPRIPKRKRIRVPLMSNGVPPNFTEAFKGVRTNVQFSLARKGPRTLVVASTGPGEGKTLVSTNLAIALAQTGRSVILIDADMRRPTVHEALGTEQEPGLSNVLVGDSKPSQAVRPSTVPGLWVLPAGRVPPNPAELLDSIRFKVLLSLLGEKFDWVILDSPPVMAVTDATVLAHSAQGVIFVVGSEIAHRGSARNAVARLLAADGKIVGAVLNRVNLDRDRYYYANYYRREYQSYQNPVLTSNIG